MATNNTTVINAPQSTQLTQFNPAQYVLDIPSIIIQMIFQPGNINRGDLIKKTIYAFMIKYCYDNLNTFGSMIFDKKIINTIILKIIYNIKFYNLKFTLENGIVEVTTGQKMDSTVINNLCDVNVKTYTGIFFKRIFGRFVIFNITETQMEIMSFCKTFNEKFMSECKLPVITIKKSIKTSYTILNFKGSGREAKPTWITPNRVTKLVDETKDIRFFKMIETFIINSEILEDIATQAYIINGSKWYWQIYHHGYSVSEKQNQCHAEN